jgi:hypothetical protein
MVRFTRAVINILADNEADPKTLRLQSLGPPDDEGIYTPIFEVQEMDPPLPEPWAFDGYRRVYDDGKPLGQWQARAIDTEDVAFEECTGRAMSSFKTGQGTTMVAARDALLELFE